MTSQPETELNQDAAEDTGDAVMDALYALEKKSQPAEEGADAPDDEAEEEAEEAESEEEEEATPEPVKAKVKVGEQELDLDEVVSGYMKDADYRQKTAKVAEQFREIETVRGHIMSKLASQATALDVFLGELHQELVGDQQDFASLLQTDPHQYLLRKEAFDKKHAKLQHGLQQRQALEQRQSEEANAAKAVREAKEQELLVAALPAWRDPVKARAESQEIGAFLVSLGYDPKDLEELSDHRAVVLARKAMLYDKQQSAKTKVAPKEAPKPIRAGTPQSNQSNRTDYDKAMARAKRSHSPADIERLLMLKGT